MHKYYQNWFNFHHKSMKGNRVCIKLVPIILENARTGFCLHLSDDLYAEFFQNFMSTS